jgi:hypothetical protein
VSSGGSGGSGEAGTGRHGSGAGGNAVSTVNNGVPTISGSGAVTGCPSFSGDPPDLEGGEYVIDGTLIEPLHLRFDSNTTAVLTSYFGAPETLEVERGSCATVEAIEIDVGQFELVGPILLYDQSGAQRLALSESPVGGVGSEAVVSQPGPCRGPQIAEAAVAPDASATEARVETRFQDLLIPWEPIELSASKPPGVPLSESIVLSAAGESIDFEIDDESQISISDWPALLGTTLEISADIVSTNGVASPFSVELPVVDLEPTTSPLDITKGAVNGVALIGESAMFLPPGDATCNDGCLSVSSIAGFAFALSGTQAKSLVVHHNGGMVDVSFGMLVSTTPAQLSLAVPGGIAETHGLPGVAEFTATEITLASELAPDEVVYGLVTGAWGSVQIQPGDACNLSGSGALVYLESIELSD